MKNNGNHFIHGIISMEPVDIILDYVWDQGSRKENKFISNSIVISRTIALIHNWIFVVKDACLGIERRSTWCFLCKREASSYSLLLDLLGGNIKISMIEVIQIMKRNFFFIDKNIFSQVLSYLQNLRTHKSTWQDVQESLSILHMNYTNQCPIQPILTDASAGDSFVGS